MSNHKSYGRLGAKFLLYVLCAYLLLFATVDTFGHAFPSNSHLYLALLLASPVLMLELLLTKSLYPNRDLNFLILTIAAGLLIGSFFFIRSQAGVDDTQLLKAMVPHHAAAVLMCQEATITDEQVKELCGNIIASHQAEVRWMEQKIESLGE